MFDLRRLSLGAPAGEACLRGLGLFFLSGLTDLHAMARQLGPFGKIPRRRCVRRDRDEQDDRLVDPGRVRHRLDQASASSAAGTICASDKPDKASILLDRVTVCFSPNGR
jgi:hypothetical protein